MSNRRKVTDRMSSLRLLIMLLAVGLVTWCACIAINSSATEPQGLDESATEADWLHPLTAPGTSEEIVEYKAFTVSFNPDLHIPNWVSWELLGSETTGLQKRRSSFRSDRQVKGCAIDKDYRGSGYDRGHMAPAGDMKWDSVAMDECFLYTNMCPQLHELNNGAWGKLEDKCRAWANTDSAIVVICGPVLVPEPDEFIGQNQVAVPKAFFKVVAAPYAKPPRGIGFIMPNGNVKGGMQAAAVSIDSVEAVTGHDFFASLPDSIQELIEGQCRFSKWR